MGYCNVLRNVIPTLIESKLNLRSKTRICGGLVTAHSSEMRYDPVRPLAVVEPQLFLEIQA
jgi:hypothetical protein